MKAVATEFEHAAKSMRKPALASSLEWTNRTLRHHRLEASDLHVTICVMLTTAEVEARMRPACSLIRRRPPAPRLRDGHGRGREVLGDLPVEVYVPVQRPGGSSREGWRPVEWSTVAAIERSPIKVTHGSIECGAATSILARTGSSSR